MKVEREVLLVGATGFTGRLVAQELQRQGVSFDVAGRSEVKLRALLEELDSAGRAVLLDMERPEPVVEALSEGTIVLNCAGPFVLTSRRLVDAIARRGGGLCYLDVSGEQQIYRDSKRAAHGLAKEQGATILHACAFESFIADMLAHALMRRGAQSLRELSSYYWFSRMVVSPGTRLTMRLVDHFETFAVEGGELLARSPGARRDVADLAIEPGRDLAVFTPYPEVLFFAESFAPETSASYLLLTPGEARLFGRSATPPEGRSVEAIVEQHERAPRREPTAKVRASQRCGVSVVKSSLAGESRMISFVGRDPYGLTASILVWAAVALRELPTTPAGVLPPGEVFSSSEFLLAIDGWTELVEGVEERALG